MKILLHSICSLVVLFSIAESKTFSLKTRRIFSNSSDPEFKKRQDLELELANDVVGYFSDVELGTPGQKVTVQIDTGSQHLWVQSPANSQCDSKINCTSALYDPSDSSTSDSTPNKIAPGKFFNITYADGSYANGEWYGDYLSLDGTSLEIPFGAADNADSSAVFGIGYPPRGDAASGYDSTITVSGKTYEYANFPLQLYNSGLTSVWGYSVWLNDHRSAEGEIIFGGTDSSKYTGAFTSVPMVQLSPIGVGLNSLTLVDELGKSAVIISQPYVALLDTGTTYLSVYPDLFDAIITTIGYSYDSTYNWYSGPCYARNGDAALKFDITGRVVSVPLSELLYNIYYTNGAPYKDSNGDEYCYAAIGSSDFIIFGDSFMRSVYVYFDLLDEVAYLADALVNVTDSSVQSLDGAPSASSATAVSSSYYGSLKETPVTPTQLYFGKSVQTTTTSGTTPSSTARAFATSSSSSVAASSNASSIVTSPTASTLSSSTPGLNASLTTKSATPGISSSLPSTAFGANTTSSFTTIYSTVSTAITSSANVSSTSPTPTGSATSLHTASTAFPFSNATASSGSAPSATATPGVCPSSPSLSPGVHYKVYCGLQSGNARSWVSGGFEDGNVFASGVSQDFHSIHVPSECSLEIVGYFKPTISGIFSLIHAVDDYAAAWVGDRNAFSCGSDLSNVVPHGPFEYSGPQQLHRLKRADSTVASFSVAAGDVIPIIISTYPSTGDAVSVELLSPDGSAVKDLFVEASAASAASATTTIAPIVAATTTVHASEIASLSTQVLTSVSGSLTITETSIITICTICEGGIGSAAPTASGAIATIPRPLEPIPLTTAPASVSVIEPVGPWATSVSPKVPSIAPAESGSSIAPVVGAAASATNPAFALVVLVGLVIIF